VGGDKIAGDGEASMITGANCIEYHTLRRWLGKILKDGPEENPWLSKEQVIGRHVDRADRLGEKLDLMRW